VKNKVEDVNGDKIFMRFYTCFKACKDNFVSCRPITGLDGCFLKGQYGVNYWLQFLETQMTKCYL